MDVSKLSEQQAKFALKIIEAAEREKINPDYALLLMFSENNFDPKELGKTEEEIMEGIDVSITYMRDQLQKFKDPEKAAIAYFEGENSPFFTSNDPNDIPLDTATRLNSIIGQLPTSAMIGEQAPEASETPQTPSVLERAAEDERIAQERSGAQQVGAAIGAVPAATRMIGDIRRGGFPAVKPPSSPSPAGPRAPIQPPSVPGMRPDLAMPGDPNIERILQGTTEEGATGRARQTGYNTETAQQAARTQQAKQTIGALQRQGLVMPRQDMFAAQPGMTSTPSGVLYPRSEPPRTLGPRGPAGEIGPTRPPAPPPPPKPGGLERVTQMFTRIAETPAVQSLGRGISRYGGPPAAGLTALGEGTTAVEEFQRGNYPATAASGLSVLGSGLMLNPGTFVPGGVLSLTGPAYRSIFEDERKPPPPELPSMMAP